MRRQLDVQIKFSPNFFDLIIKRARSNMDLFFQAIVGPVDLLIQCPDIKIHPTHISSHILHFTAEPINGGQHFLLPVNY